MSDSVRRRGVYPPDSSVYRTLQARIPQRVAMPSSRGSSQLGDGPASLTSPALAGGLFTAAPPGKPPL